MLRFTREPDLIDPTRVRAADLQRLLQAICGTHEGPLTHFYLQAGLNNFRAQLPPRDDAWPAYLVHIWPDGVMEFGTALEPALRFEDPDDNRIIASPAMAYYIYDYLALFVRVFEHVGYGGEVVAQVSFDNVRDHRLAVAADRYFPSLRPIEEDTVGGPLWAGSIRDLGPELGGVAKRALDRDLSRLGDRERLLFHRRGGNLLERR